MPFVKGRNFQGRLSELASRVGTGSLTGRVVFDQIYAATQHNAIEFVHFGGGEAFYLTKAIRNQSVESMERLARAVLDGDLTQAMIANVESVAREASDRAPFEFGDLKASANPQVRDNRKLVYDRAPMKSRLSRAEIKIKARLRTLGLGNW